MQQAYKSFLENEFIPLLRQLNPYDKGRWGKMHAQQMVEHFEDAVRLASGKVHFPAVGDADTVKKSYDFMMSDKPFRENTRNPYMGDEPEAYRHETMEEAIENLKHELLDFFHRYEAEPGLRILNPFFGNLDYDEQLQLLHKHAKHHLRQFGLTD